MIFNTRESVFPLLCYEFEPGQEVCTDNVRDSHYLGTAFCIPCDPQSGQVAFVTARHVVDMPLKANQRIGIGKVGEQGMYWWDHWEFHRSADLATAHLKRGTLPVNPILVCRPDYLLGMGREVFTFGFPLSTRERTDGRTKLWINETFFSGYVATFYDAAALTASTPIQYPFEINYALSLECPEGLSGAPLLVKSEEGFPVVCGMVYGNKSTHFLIDSSHAEEAEGKVTWEHTYRMHHFGLASGLKELADPNDAFSVPRHLYEYPIEDNA